MSGREARSNRVDADEVFTGSKVESKPVVPPEIERQYVRVGDKFYHPKNTDVVAFEDRGNRLETRSDSERVAETMVTIARARGWDEIKVSGSETFRKEAWLEAAAHGMQVKGYTPSERDKAELAARTREVDVNAVTPDAKAARERESVTAEHLKRAHAFAQEPPADAVKDHPDLAGAYAALAAVERKTEADQLTPQQRAIVLARVRENVVNAIERGQLPEVKVREERQIQRQRDEEREIGR